MQLIEMRIKYREKVMVAPQIAIFWCLFALKKRQQSKSTGPSSTALVSCHMKVLKSALSFMILHMSTYSPFF